MIEQYIYNLITADPELSELLEVGSGDYALYPGVVPKSVDIEKAVTFTLIGTLDRFPNIRVATVQFNIFAKTHTDTVEIARALSYLFNGDHNQQSGGEAVYYSQRVSESDLGFNFDDGIYQREATYSFHLR